MLGFDRFDNQFVDRRSAGQWQCHYRFRCQSMSNVPGITRTAVIMSPSNVLLNTLASIPYIFNRCESRQRTRHVYWKPPGGCRKIVPGCQHLYYYRRRVCVCVCVCTIWPISARTISFRHQTSRKFFSHSNFPMPYLWTAFCVPLSFVFYEKQ